MEIKAELVPLSYSKEDVEIIKNQIAKGCSDLELGLFLKVCQKSQLDPFTRQIYAIQRGGKMTIQTSIDGFRLIAQRSGDYEGQVGPYWCGDDAVWKDVWISNKKPTAAKVGVYRKGFREPTWGIANFKAYEQTSPIWNKMPELMIAKCAESLALRKAYPNELSGLYTEDEMPEEKQIQAEVLPAQLPLEKKKKLEELCAMAKMSIHNLNEMIKVKWKLDSYELINEEQYQKIVKYLQEEAQKELSEEK